ncbi:hypothetical protein BGZ82_005619 [Podila clonocystis]|nr:hypothetical protein BGZ82_005619 [Podila clonocystis]
MNEMRELLGQLKEKREGPFESSVEFVRAHAAIVERVKTGDILEYAAVAYDRLKSKLFLRRLLAINDARARVRYEFAGCQIYLLTPTDGSEAQPALEEEISVE